jgi:hypothetical protein
MKKLVIFGLLFSLRVLAQSNESLDKATVKNAFDENKNQYAAGFIYNQFEYSEPHMSDKGPMTGLALSYTRLADPDAFSYTINGELSSGIPTYNGETMSGKAISGGSRYQIADIEWRGQIPIYYEYDELFTAVFGIGYRNTHMFNGEMPGDYTRDITYLYIPVGVKLDFTRNENWKSNLRIELNLLRSGVVKTNLSDVDPSLPDVTNNQKSGTGVRVGYENIINKKYLANISALRWSIPNSDVAMVTDQGGFLEPSNGTWVYSMTLGYVW